MTLSVSSLSLNSVTTPLLRNFFEEDLNQYLVTQKNVLLTTQDNAELLLNPSTEE